MNRRRQACRRDQGCERGILNQTRDNAGFTIHQGSAELSCRRFRQLDLSEPGTGLQLEQGRRERPPKLRTLENTPAMHQMGGVVVFTGVPLALRPGFKHCRTRNKNSQRSRPGLGRQPEDQGSLRGRVTGVSIQPKKNGEGWSRNGQAQERGGKLEGEDGSGTLRGLLRV